MRTELADARYRTELLTRDDAGTLQALDVAAHRQEVNALLLRASDLVRDVDRHGGVDRRGADLIGS